MNRDHADPTPRRATPSAAPCSAHTRHTHARLLIELALISNRAPLTT